METKKEINMAVKVEHMEAYSNYTSTITTATKLAQECDKKRWGALECQCLKAHNDYRREHNTPPLILSKKLNKKSSAWAKKLAKKGEMEHSSGTKYGENLYYCSGFAKVTGDMAVKSWYDEIEMYDFDKSEFIHGTGHFTQLIWKASKELGVGYAKKGKKFFVVCNYYPAGNVVGYFRENVLPKD